MKSFEEFIEEGIIKKVSTDIQRAKFLIKESEKDYSFLQEMITKLGINDESANLYVKYCYDIFMGLIRAKMLLDAFNASGQGAHEAEISFLEILKFNKDDIKFADKIRYFRNGMLYYGTILDKEYAEKVIKFTNRIYNQLREILPK